MCTKDQFFNGDLIKKSLLSDKKKAEILGKDDFADTVLSRRMAKNGKGADDFVSKLKDQTMPFFIKENQELEKFKAEKTNQKYWSPGTMGSWVLV